ncbi:hypothetical protein VTJ04DRAFT_2581 [Mycothermus thermophilus]|uniref:uncharacterized protein n=1 Tax=Humicola insolens TaxID=85995 RepID=UPI00374469EF
MADLVLLFLHPRCKVDLGWASTARVLPIRKGQGDMMDGGEKRRSRSSSSQSAGLGWAKEEKRKGVEEATRAYVLPMYMDRVHRWVKDTSWRHGRNALHSGGSLDLVPLSLSSLVLI